MRDDIVARAGVHKGRTGISLGLPYNGSITFPGRLATGDWRLAAAERAGHSERAAARRGIAVVPVQGLGSQFPVRSIPDSRFPTHGRFFAIQSGPMSQPRLATPPSIPVIDPNELRVTRIRALRGPNYWRLAPVIAC